LYSSLRWLAFKALHHWAPFSAASPSPDSVTMPMQEVRRALGERRRLVGAHAAALHERRERRLVEALLSRVVRHRVEHHALGVARRLVVRVVRRRQLPVDRVAVADVLRACVHHRRQPAEHEREFLVLARGHAVAVEVGALAADQARELVVLHQRGVRVHAALAHTVRNRER
jgi:hypothetical protein